MVQNRNAETIDQSYKSKEKDDKQSKKKKTRGIEGI